MRLSRLYFCYGSILTSTLWLALIIVYFRIHDSQVPSVHSSQVTRGENVVSPRNPSLGRSRQLITRNNTSSLPDLDQLAIIRSSQDKLIRAEGKSCTLVEWWF